MVMMIINSIKGNSNNKSNDDEGFSVLQQLWKQIEVVDKKDKYQQQ